MYSTFGDAVSRSWQFHLTVAFTLALFLLLPFGAAVGLRGDMAALSLPGLETLWMVLFAINESLLNILTKHKALIGDPFGLMDDLLSQEMRTVLRVLDKVAVAMFGLTCAAVLAVPFLMTHTPLTIAVVIVQVLVLAFTMHVYFREHGWQLTRLQFLTGFRFY